MSNDKNERHELTILTNDGWVVSLIGDKSMCLEGATLETVIVQPKEDFDRRMKSETSPISRVFYRIGARGIQKNS